MKVSPGSGEKNPLERLQVMAKMRRRLLSWEWVRVQVLDFCADGMTIRTDEDLLTGGRNIFSVYLTMDLGDISISKIEGVAQTRKKFCSCFDYPVKFDFSNCSAANRDNMVKSLQRIDSLLAGYNALVKRMQSGPNSAV